MYMYVKNKVAKPTVFIPVFPGTNCEYDSMKAFVKAGQMSMSKCLEIWMQMQYENRLKRLKRQ